MRNYDDTCPFKDDEARFLPLREVALLRREQGRAPQVPPLPLARLYPR